MTQCKKIRQRNRSLTGAAVIAVAGSLFSVVCLYSFTTPTEDSRSKQPKLLYQDIIQDEKAGMAQAALIQPKGGINAIIEGLAISPERPTCADSIRVDVKTFKSRNEKITYEYHWQINGKEIAGDYGNTLPAGLVKKRDRITITVIPFIEGKPYKDFGYTLHTFIHNAAPGLVLREDYHKAGDVIEFQLAGEDPDGDKITYALEKPALEGMTIDKDTGKITWKLPKEAKGTYRFAAAAADSGGSKTINYFEISLETK